MMIRALERRWIRWIARGRERKREKERERAVILVANLCVIHVPTHNLYIIN